MSAEGQDQIMDIGGVPHQKVLLRVEETDEQGRPEQLTLIPPERGVELSRDNNKNRFISAWTPVTNLAPR